MIQLTREEVISKIEQLVPIENENQSSIFVDPLPRDDSTFDIITNLLTSPPEELNSGTDHDAIKLSFRAMSYLVKDTEDLMDHKQRMGGMESDALYMKRILNPTRAGLLSKKIFSAYRHLEKSIKEDQMNISSKSVPYIPHLNKMLTSLLAAYPTQVVGASCAGGKDGIELSLLPMIQLHKHIAESRGITENLLQEMSSSSDMNGNHGLSLGVDTGISLSPLSTMSAIITVGCTGRKKDGLSLQQQQQAYMSGDMSQMDEVLISKGHRRKFVHSLSQWGGFSHFMDLILQDSSDQDDVVDIFLSCTESIVFPQQLSPTLMAMGGRHGSKEAKEDESVGEEALFSCLANETILERLLQNAKQSNKNDSSYIPNALVGLFEIASGKARKRANPPMVDATEDDGSIECKASDDVKAAPSPGIDDNKLIKSGITDKIHAALTAHLKGLLDAMDIYMTREKGRVIRHPGRYVVEKSFTSNRLQMLTLFADLITYESHYDSKARGNRKSAIAAMDAIMSFPCPPEDEHLEENVVYNPWPGICDALFNYSENNMLQFQFYRLIHSLCITNHEATLKLLVQKCKFLSRAIKVCSDPSPCSTKGILLSSLNALRLHSQSISSHSFLRHYMDSHDGWKSYREELVKVTMDQQQKGGGIAVPNGTGKESITFKVESINIDLGSQYATEMGFGGIDVYDDLNDEVLEDDIVESNGSPSNKKKKKKKPKKKK